MIIEFLGSVFGRMNYNDVYELDVSSLTWSKVLVVTSSSSPPTGSYGHSMVLGPTILCSDLDVEANYPRTKSKSKSSQSALRYWFTKPP